MVTRPNSYFACGVVGYLASLALAMHLAADLELAPRLVIAIVPFGVFLSLIKLSTAVFGYERIVFYEKAIAIISITSACAWLAGAPLRIALDITTLGVGTFLAFGRIGCHQVACCHGRPTQGRLGIRYSAGHVRAGLEPHLLDTPLVPTQLLDAMASATAVLVGASFSSIPGRAAALYILIYGTARFVLELVRGDARPYWLGLSEAQWTAVGTCWCVVPLHPIAVVFASALTLATLGIVLARRVRWPLRYWLAHPRHTYQLAAILLARTHRSVRTCEGLDISIHTLDATTIDLVASHPEHSLDPDVLVPAALRLGARWQLVAAVRGTTPHLVHVLLRRIAAQT